MSYRLSCAIAALAFGLLIQAASAGTMSFQGLGDLAGGTYASHANAISADGRVIVGWSQSDSGKQAFKWQNGVMTALPVADSEATGVSADGTYIVGSRYLSTSPVAFRCYPKHLFGSLWTTRVEDLGSCYGYGASRATGVSADGSVIVGTSWSSSGTTRQATRWTAAGTATGLGSLVPDGWSEATGISADGSVVVGNAQAEFMGLPNLRGPYQWTSTTGMQDLGFHPERDAGASAVSADGTTVVGYAAWDDITLLPYQLRNGSLIPLTRSLYPRKSIEFDLPFGSEALATSGNGSVAVGWTDVYGAFVWSELYGFRSLADYLSSHGADLTGWRLQSATGVSADGLTLVGYGINPQGNTEAWVAYLPEPSTVLLLGIPGLLVITRRRMGASRRR